MNVGNRQSTGYSPMGVMKSGESHELAAHDEEVVCEVRQRWKFVVSKKRHNATQQRKTSRTRGGPGSAGVDAIGILGE